MEGRVESGIEGLDELLGGGLPSHGTYAIVGDSGTGKSILSFQFLYNGAIKYGEPGVYILLEEQRESMLANMRGFGWDIEKLEAEGKLKVIPYTKSILGDVEATFERGALAAEQERLNHLRQYLTLESLFTEIEQTVKRMGAKRVVIDSLTVVTLLTESQLMTRMEVMWLIEKLRKLNVTTLMTVEEGIGFWRDTLFLCDGIIEMIMREKGGIYERGLIIEKMRSSNHDTGVRPLKITDKGIKIYPKEVINR